jgi:Trp operon repressor
MTKAEGVEWRKEKVLELLSQGNNQADISRILQISLSTINRDFMCLRQQAKDNIKKFVDEKLP